VLRISDQGVDSERKRKSEVHNFRADCRRNRRKSLALEMRGMKIQGHEISEDISDRTKSGDTPVRLPSLCVLPG
jgi:hypothetical protein